MSSHRDRLFAGVFAALSLTGAGRVLAPLARGRGVILTFHHVRPFTGDPGFAPNRLLEVTPGFLDTVLAILRDENFALVPLDEVPERLGQDGPRFAALTFDDGYRDNRDYALPVLRRHGAPATLFITTDYAEGGGRLWWLELEESLRRLDRLSLPEHGLDLDIRAPAAKREAFALVYRRLRAGPEPALRATIASLAARAGVEATALVRRHCLGFEELAALTSEPLLTFGAHTLSHPMLAKHDADTARREIAESRRILEERLGGPVRHIAYPVGDPTSAGPREFALAREAGFVTGVTTRPGHLYTEHRHHLHALPRVSMNGLHQTEVAARGLLSGVPLLAWNRGRRVNAA